MSFWRKKKKKLLSSFLEEEISFKQAKFAKGNKFHFLERSFFGKCQFLRETEFFWEKLKFSKNIHFL